MAFIYLQEKAHLAQEYFSDLPGLSLQGDSLSVVKHLRVANSNGNREDDKHILNQIVMEVKCQFYYSNFLQDGSFQ